MFLKQKQIFEILKLWWYKFVLSTFSKVIASKILYAEYNYQKVTLETLYFPLCTGAPSDANILYLSFSQRGITKKVESSDQLINIFYSMSKAELLEYRIMLTTDYIF